MIVETTTIYGSISINNWDLNSNRGEQAEIEVNRKIDYRSVLRMNENKVSQTALGAASLRYVHQILDHEPKIHEDLIIGKIIGSNIINKIEVNQLFYISPRMTSLRSSIVLRSRLAEDHLLEAYKSNIRQYLILGAGFDTFPYRQPEWAKQLKIFEVDHPATQEDKLNRLHRANIDIPPNLVFVPIDFECDNLDNELTKHGFRKDIPVFISWLGVTVYLSENAIDNMLKYIISFAPKSEIVFSFVQKREEASQNNQQPLRDEKYTLAKVGAAVGEPWTSFFTLEELERKLDKFGFKQIKFLDPKSYEKYYYERTDGLKPPQRVSLVHAVV